MNEPNVRPTDIFFEKILPASDTAHTCGAPSSFHQTEESLITGALEFFGAITRTDAETGQSMLFKSAASAINDPVSSSAAPMPIIFTFRISIGKPGRTTERISPTFGFKILFG